MKKTIIKLTDVPDASFELIGISSHENDYRLSWAINSQLNINFNRIDNFSVKDEKTQLRKEFSQYEYNDEEALIKLLLLSNRSENGYLLPELKNMDFFIVLLGETDKNYIQNFVKELQKVNIVSIATQIEISSLKSIKKMIFNL